MAQRLCATGFYVSETQSIGYVRKNTSELNWPILTTHKGSNVWKKAVDTIHLPVIFDHPLDQVSLDLLSLAERIQEQSCRAIRGFNVLLKCARVHLRGEQTIAACVKTHKRMTAAMMQRQRYSGVVPAVCPVSANTSLVSDSCLCYRGLSARDTCLLRYLQVVRTLQPPSPCPSLPLSCAYLIQTPWRQRLLQILMINESVSNWLLAHALMPSTCISEAVEESEGLFPLQKYQPNLFFLSD